MRGSVNTVSILTHLSLLDVDFMPSKSIVLYGMKGSDKHPLASFVRNVFDLKLASDLTNKVIDLMKHQAGYFKQDDQYDSLEGARDPGTRRVMRANTRCQRFCGFPSIPSGWK